MSIDATLNDEFSAYLVEPVPVNVIRDILRFGHHADILLQMAEKEGVAEAYVHYHLAKQGENAGRILVMGVSLNRDDATWGRHFDNVGYGAMVHARARYDQIRAATQYNGALYAIARSPTSDTIIADSRKS